MKALIEFLLKHFLKDYHLQRFGKKRKDKTAVTINTDGKEVE